MIGTKSKQEGATGASSGLKEPYNERMRVMPSKIGPFMLASQLCVSSPQSHCHPIQFVLETEKIKKSLINNKATLNFQEVKRALNTMYRIF